MLFLLNLLAIYLEFEHIKFILSQLFFSPALFLSFHIAFIFFFIFRSEIWYSYIQLSLRSSCTENFLDIKSCCLLINSGRNSFSTMDDIWKTKKKTYFIGKYKLILSLKHKTRQKEGCLSGLLLGFVEDILLSVVKIYSLCLYICQTVEEDSEENEINKK